MTVAPRDAQVLLGLPGLKEEARRAGVRLQTREDDDGWLHLTLRGSAAAIAAAKAKVESVLSSPPVTPTTAPAAGEERRVDPADGVAYTRDEFVAEYGGTRSGIRQSLVTAKATAPQPPPPSGPSAAVAALSAPPWHGDGGDDGSESGDEDEDEPELVRGEGWHLPDRDWRGGARGPPEAARKRRADDPADAPSDGGGHRVRSVHPSVARRPSEAPHHLWLRSVVHLGARVRDGGAGRQEPPHDGQDRQPRRRRARRRRSSGERRRRATRLRRPPSSPPPADRPPRHGLRLPRVFDPQHCDATGDAGVGDGGALGGGGGVAAGGAGGTRGERLLHRHGEFEVRRDLVGRIIGSRGATIRTCASRRAR